MWLKIVETSTDGECGINLADGAEGGLRARAPVLKEVLLRVKRYQTASCATEQRSWREESVDEADYTLILRNRPSHTRHPRQSGTIHTEIRPSTSKKIVTTQSSDSEEHFQQ